MTGASQKPDILASDGDPGVVACLAAEAVRAVNRLTLLAPAAGVPGWEAGSDIYRVLGELSLLVERMPQVLGQLARYLDRPASR